MHSWPLLTWDLRYRLNFFALLVHLPHPPAQGNEYMLGDLEESDCKPA